MKPFVLLTDSSCDFDAQKVEELGIEVIPLTFLIDEKEYKNDLKENEISIQEVYEKLRNGERIKTAQINPNTFEETFEKYLSEGKDILYVGFSSALSNTYQSSLIAKESMLVKYPDCKLYCVDSLSASLGEGLLVYYVALKKKTGASIEECYQEAENLKLKVNHLFTVDDLNFLKRGGRLSASKAFLGSLFSLKPILHMSDEGKLVPIGKILGRRHSLKNLVQRMLEKATNLQDQVIFISHGDCLEEVDDVISFIKENVNPKEIYVNYIGPVIGSHSGPNTLAIFFLSEKR